MKNVRRIGLFIIIGTCFMTLGAFLTWKAEHFFYPNRYKDNTMENKVLDEEVDESDSQESPIPVFIPDIPVVSADTEYVLEIVNLTDGSIEEISEPVPVKYIGLSREELLAEIATYDENPPLSELEKGFTTMEMTAFSKDKIAICKYYKEKDKDTYYLMVSDHFVMVYCSDKKTLFMNTDILLEQLDDKLQMEIIKGKRMESQEELYNFLESYSS